MGTVWKSLVPQYLDFSLESLINNQQKLREQFAEALGQTPFALLEEQTRKNMAAFANALRMLSPFGMGRLRLAGEAEGGERRALRGDRGDAPRDGPHARTVERLAPSAKPAGREPSGSKS